MSTVKPLNLLAFYNLQFLRLLSIFDTGVYLAHATSDAQNTKLNVKTIF